VAGHLISDPRREASPAVLPQIPEARPCVFCKIPLQRCLERAATMYPPFCCPRSRYGPGTDETHPPPPSVPPRPRDSQE
jgi:hypothetical protein